MNDKLIRLNINKEFCVTETEKLLYNIYMSLEDINDLLKKETAKKLIKKTAVKGDDK